MPSEAREVNKAPFLIQLAFQCTQTGNYINQMGDVLGRKWKDRNGILRQGAGKGLTFPRDLGTSGASGPSSRGHSKH